MTALYTLLRNVLLAACFVELTGALCYAQVPEISQFTSTPLPGVGHDYIGMLSETVDPASGSVSLRISTPTPPGRRLTMPFSFSYSSGSVYGASSNGWNGPSGGYITVGGWTYSLPMASVTFNHRKRQTGAKTFVTCQSLANYVFYDSVGTRHKLRSGEYPESGASPCPTRSLPAAGSGVAASIIFDPYPKVVATADGTVYHLSSPIVDTFNGVSNGVDYIPDFIEDTNGNQLTINNISGNNVVRGGAFTVSDDVGRTLISSSGIGSTGNTVSIAGLSNPYTFTWTTVPINFTTTWTNVHWDQFNGCFPPIRESRTQLRALV